MQDKRKYKYRMVLVPKGYPDRKLDDDEMGTSRKLIREHIFGFPEDVLPLPASGMRGDHIQLRQSRIGELTKKLF